MLERFGNVVYWLAAIVAGAIVVLAGGLLLTFNSDFLSSVAAVLGAAAIFAFGAIIRYIISGPPFFRRGRAG